MRRASWRCCAHLKLVVTNYPADQIEWLDASYWPHDVPKEGSRPIPFSKELWIEQDDFLEDPPKKFYRLSPGREVRLRYGYIIKCTDVVKDAAGNVIEVRCTYDPATRSGNAPDGRKVEGTIHWLSAAKALPCEIRLYDRLLKVAVPEEDENHTFLDFINSDSLQLLPNAFVEPSVATDSTDTRYQFERQGYFWQDPVDSAPGRLVFNRIVTLRDTWAKLSGEGGVRSAERDGDNLQSPTANLQSQNNEVTTPRERLAGRADDALVAKFETLTALGLSEEDAEVLTRDAAVVDLFDDALAAHGNARGVAGIILNEVLREIKDKSLDSLRFGGKQLGALVKLVDEGVISSAIAKTVFGELLQNGGDPAQIVESKGLKQVADAGSLLPIVQKVIAANADKAAQLRGGKGGLMGFFVGQVMKETGGKANAQLVQELLQKNLRKG